MRLVPAQLHVPLVGGLDTKSDQKGVALTKLTRLENGEFTKKGSIRKRPGSRALSTFLDDSIAAGTLTAPINNGRALAALDDQLVLFTRDAVHAYTETADRWTRVTSLTPVSISTSPGPFSGREQLYGDSVVVGGYRFAAWEEGTSLIISVYSADGGLIATSSIATSRSPRWVPIGETVHLYYADSANNDLKIRRFPLADPKSGLTSVLTPITDLSALTLYDVIPDGAGALLAWYTDTNVVRLGRVNSAGAIVASGAINTLAGILALSFNTVTGTRGVICYCTAAAVTAYLVDTGAYTAVDITQVLDEASGSISTGVRTSVAAATGNKVAVFVERTAASNSNFSVNWIELDITDWPFSVTPASQRIRHAHIASHAYNPGGGIIGAACWLGFESTLQSTAFLYSFSGTTSTLMGRALPGRSSGVLTRAYVPGANATGTTLGLRRQLPLVDTQTTTAFFEHKGFEQVLTDYTHRPRSVDAGGALYTTGGQLTAFDGTNAVESGFHLFPEGVTSANNGAGNLTAAGVYGYRVYYEWYTAAGERFKSLAISFNHTVSGTAQTVRLTIPTLTHTCKTAVSIAVYRTEANSGTLFYRVSGNNPAVGGTNGWITNVLTADTITFDDNLADANILARERDYLSEDPQPLANTSPESGTVVLTAQNRLWLAGGTLSESAVQFSKIRFDGEPVEFAGELLLTLPEAGGPVIALGEVNNAVIAFKRDRIYAIVGTGPDNTGNGVYLAEHITSDVGCINPDTVVQTPDGLMFLSAKGIYLLTQSLTVVYIGAEVEAYNAVDFTAGRLVPDTNQVVFLAAEAPSLMYDYFYQQWSVWTGTFFGVDAITWRDVDFSVLQSDGQVFVRDPSVFLDGGNPYYLRITTAPIRLRDHLLGFNKLRRVLVLGENRSTHQLSVGMLYDQDVGPFQTLLINPANFIDTGLFGSGGLLGGGELFGGSLAGAQYLFEFRPKRTKFSTIRFDFTDVISGEAGASYEISEILLDCYELSDAPKLGAARKV